MEKSIKLSFQKGDWIAIVLVVLLAGMVAAAFFPKRTAQTTAFVQIYQDGKLIKEVSLKDSETIRITGEYHNTVVVDQGRVAVTESDCPGTDCVHSGWMEHAGRSIVCLPNKVEVRIVGTAGDVDFVVR